MDIYVDIHMITWVNYSFKSIFHYILMLSKIVIGSDFKNKQKKSVEKILEYFIYFKLKIHVELQYI